MSQTISFFLSAMRACKCGKPASYEVRATGNVTYDYCCKRCAPRRVKELTKAYANVNKSLAQDGSNA